MSVVRGGLHPREALVATMGRIYRLRLTTTSGGNLSIRDADDCIWITPARVDKGDLRPEDIVCVHPDGRVDGLHPPSSELPFHQAIYRTRPDVRALVHAHPVALVAFSLCRQVPDTRLLHPVWTLCGLPGLAPYEVPGSDRLGERIAETFARGHHGVLLENHGVVVAGADMSEAFERFETLEFAARVLLGARFLGRVRNLTREQLAMGEHRPSLAEAAASFAPADGEAEWRETLAGFVRRGYAQRLLTSTMGDLSARLGDDDFLITPHGGDRGLMEGGELVRVCGGEAEPGKPPSRAAACHREMYRRHPDIQAVAHAYPLNATAFSVSGAELDARTLPESYQFVREVVSVPYGVIFAAPERLAQRLCVAERPAALIENDGLLAIGRTILEAFDRLEVLETMAEVLLVARRLGPVRPMPEPVLRALLKGVSP